jgi:hypothetical protein
VKELADMDRWDFLAVPLDHLLTQCGARIGETTPDHPRFMGGIVSNACGLALMMPIGQPELEREGVARGLLARWFGRDVTDWPVPVEFTEAVPE